MESGTPEVPDSTGFAPKIPPPPSPPSSPMKDMSSFALAPLTAATSFSRRSVSEYVLPADRAGKKGSTREVKYLV